MPTMPTEPINQNLNPIYNTGMQLIQTLSPITSTTSQTSTTCAPEYNTVTYSVDGQAYMSARQSGTIPDTVHNALIKLKDDDNTSLTMCVKKKCPDGNYATNIGKLMDPEQNIYGCLYFPDNTLSDGKTSSTCKSGETISLGNNINMCVSTPQIYFPKFQ